VNELTVSSAILGLVDYYMFLQNSYIEYWSLLKNCHLDAWFSVGIEHDESDDGTGSKAAGLQPEVGYKFAG
jgi:hypothetical protein